MAGVLMALAGIGEDGLRVDLPLGYYAWGDKYSAGEQYGATATGFGLLGGNFTPATWQGRTLRAVMHEYDYYGALSRTLVALDGYNGAPAPVRLVINGTAYTLSAGSISWGTILSGITFSPSPTNSINWTAHGLAVGDPVQFYCTGGMPSGIAANTVYYVQSVVSSNAIKVTATPGGGVLSFTGNGSGTRYGYKGPITSYQMSGAISGNVFGAMLPLAATISIASPAVVTATGHSLVNGDKVQLTTSGALPGGLAANTTYYVVNAVTNMFNLAATPGGSAIGTYGSQSGSHVVRAVVTVTIS